MSEFFYYIFIFAFGIFLGTVFFGGLWLTVKKGLNSRYPSLWFALSLIVRLAIVLAGCYFIVSEFTEGNRAVRLLVCLAGLIAARMVITKRIGTDFSVPGEKL